MLTVDYDRLGLEPGDRMLDLGAGLGRHAFEAFRRGASVTAVDVNHDELRSCTNTFAAMAEAGEVPHGATAASLQASALTLPFTDGCFDRIIASEVLEHIEPDQAALAELARVLRPGGCLAVTVPAWLAETVCWKLSQDYHAPAVAGGHLRIYSAAVLRSRLRQAGLEPFATGRAHGLHTPYWWLRCQVGINNDGHPLVRAYHRVLVWDISQRPWLTRLADAVANRIAPKSIVVYARRRRVEATDVAG